MDFSYPVKFVSSDGLEFKVRITKVNKHSWWLKLLDATGKEINLIKVQKRSSKVFYHHPQKGGDLIDGKTFFKTFFQPLKRVGFHKQPTRRQTSR